MSTYNFTYIALIFFATSLAVADETMHSGSANVSTDGARAVAKDAKKDGADEESNEVDNALGLSVIDALENAEKSLGKRRSTGELADVAAP